VPKGARSPEPAPEPEQAAEVEPEGAEPKSASEMRPGVKVRVQHMRTLTDG
jgi:hypothetical protein